MTKSMMINWAKNAKMMLRSAAAMSMKKLAVAKGAAALTITITTIITTIITTVVLVKTRSMEAVAADVITSTVRRSRLVLFCHTVLARFFCWLLFSVSFQ